MSTILWSFSIWSKLERWISSITGWTDQKSKIVVLKCFILCNNNKAFLDWTVTCDESGFCLTTGNNQLSDLNKKKLQSTSHSQTCMRKRSWSLFGGLLKTWSTTAFWILAKPLHLRSLLSKLKICTKTAMPATSTGQQKGPNSLWQRPTTCCTTKTSEAEQIGLRRSAYPLCSPDLSKFNHYFFKQLNNFLQGKCFYNQQEAENAFQGFVKSQSMGFYATGINEHFSLAKMCWLQWFLFWLMKMCLSPVIMI